MSNENIPTQLAFRPDPKIVRRLEAWKEVYKKANGLRNVTNEFALPYLISKALDAEGIGNGE